MNPGGLPERRREVQTADALGQAHPVMEYSRR